MEKIKHTIILNKHTDGNVYLCRYPAEECDKFIKLPEGYFKEMEIGELFEFSLTGCGTNERFNPNLSPWFYERVKSEDENKKEEENEDVL